MALELTTETSDSLIRTLRELVQIPSISLEGPDSASINECANRVADEFRSLGASVEMLEIPDAPPAVFGEFKSSNSDAPTVLLYSHYDVQPADRGDPHRDPGHGRRDH